MVFKKVTTTITTEQYNDSITFQKNAVHLLKERVLR